MIKTLLIAAFLLATACLADARGVTCTTVCTSDDGRCFVICY